MKYHIELNVADIKVRLLNRLKEVAKKNGCETMDHGWDRLVIVSDLKKFNKLVTELDNTCKFYGVKYESLLNLD